MTNPSISCINGWLRTEEHGDIKLSSIESVYTVESRPTKGKPEGVIVIRCHRRDYELRVPTLVEAQKIHSQIIKL